MSAATVASSYFQGTAMTYNVMVILHSGKFYFISLTMQKLPQHHDDLWEQVSPWKPEKHLRLFPWLPRAIIFLQQLDNGSYTSLHSDLSYTVRIIFC